jgi:hypothetical protein
MEQRYSIEELLKRCALAMSRARRLTKEVTIEVERAMGLQDEAARQVAPVPKHRNRDNARS